MKNFFFFLLLFILFLFPLNLLFGANKKEVILNEIMWGKDKDGEEWIELKNLTVKDIRLEGWQILDAKRNKGTLEISKGIIPKKGYFLICEKNSIKECDLYESISLSNDYKSNGKLVLKDKEGDIIDETPEPEDNKWPAGKSQEVSMQREFKNGIPLDSWQDNENPSPQFSGISLFANAGANIISLTNQEITFDASLSSGNIEKYFWNFGDGETAEGKIVTHKYRFAGKYIVSLRITDGKKWAEDIVEVTIFSDAIFISEFSLAEGWVEIVNESKEIQDISGWGISDKREESDFVFPEGSYIAPEGFLFISSSLLNKVSFQSGSLFLLYPSKDVRQEIKYEKDNKELVVARERKDYFYTATPTPGVLNIISLDTKKEIVPKSSSPNLSSQTEEKSKVQSGKVGSQKELDRTKTGLKSETQEAKMPPEKILTEDLLAKARGNQKMLTLSFVVLGILSGFLGFGLVKLRRHLRKK